MDRPTILYFVIYLITLNLNYAQPTKPCTQVTIGGHPSYPPIEWVVYNNVEGAGIKIATTIFNKLGIQARTKNLGSIPATLTALETNTSIDMTTGIFYAPKRTRYLHYIKPAYAYDELAVFTRKGEALAFHSWHDLKNKSGASALGQTTGNPELDHILDKELKVQHIERVNLAFHKLAKHRLDYVVAPRFTGIIEIKKEFNEKIISLEKPFSAAGIYFAFAKHAGCERIYQQFSNELAKMLNQGQIKKMIHQAYASYVYQDRLGIITKEYDESEK